MKKNYAFITLITAASIFGSCSKEKLNVKADGQSSTNQTNSSGDGALDLLGYGYNVTGEYGNSSAATYKIIDVDRLKIDFPNRVETDLSKKQEGKMYTAENAQS